MDEREAPRRSSTGIGTSAFTYGGKTLPYFAEDPFFFPGDERASRIVLDGTRDDVNPCREKMDVRQVGPSSSCFVTNVHALYARALHTLIVLLHVNKRPSQPSQSVPFVY